MNSKKLIKKFPEVYKKFFQKNSIVVSSPLLINRCDDLFPDYSGLSIKQKIPFRVYAGISKNGLDKITLNKIHYRDELEDKFIKRDMLGYAPCFYNMLEILNKKYSHLVKKYGGFKINILGEMGRGKGMGFGSIVSLIIAALFKRIEGEFDQDKIQKADELTVNEVIHNEDLGIRDVLFDAFEIDLEIYGKTFYTRKISTLFNSHYPIISFTADNPDNNASGIDKFYKRFGFRMGELFEGLRDVPYLPVDRGVIYTGKPVLLEQIVSRNLINIDMYADMRKVFKKKFKGYFDDLLPAKRPKFYNNFLEGSENSVIETYGKMMGIISLEILYFMYNLYSQGYSDYDMKFFKKALEKIKYANHITREDSESLIGFLNKLLGNLATSRNYISVFPNDTSIMGGCVCFVMPSEGFRKVLFDAIEQTKKDFPGINLLYADRLDGGEYEGIRFDQDLEKGIFSEFLNHSSCIVRNITGESFVGDHEDCISKCDEGLLLDIVDNKIFINGKKVTSDDLHSQSATIEILKILIENLGNDVSNEDLPKSSYSKNKNEMLGKIVIPLIELVEKEIGKKLPLICKGSIYDFYVKLNKSDTKISVLNKI